MTLEAMAARRGELLRIAGRYCGDQADDAVQQALLIAARRPDATGSTTGWGWLCTVVKHEAIRLYRQQKLTLPLDGHDPACGAGDRDVVIDTRQAMLTLNSDQRRALSLLALGYSHREIARGERWTLRQVERRLTRARATLREAVAA